MGRCTICKSSRQFQEPVGWRAAADPALFVPDYKSPGRRLLAGTIWRGL